MSYYVKEQAVEAKKIYESLSDEQVIELGRIGKEIIEVQRQITVSINEKGLGNYCGISCGSECCMQKHEVNIFDPYYFVLALVAFSDEVRREVMETAECFNLSPRCMYLDDDGCRIAEDSRPYTCKIWFCGSKQRMIDIIKEFHGRFTKLFQDFRAVVDGG